jgi:hypothetical protein
MEFLVEGRGRGTQSRSGWRCGRETGWLNKGVFISIAGRQPGGVIYETYQVA